MGIEVYQGGGDPLDLPGLTRFAQREFIPPISAPASGFTDFFRSPPLGAIPGTAMSNQGVGANFTYVIDVATQSRFMRHTFAGFSSICCMVIDPALARVYPLIPQSAPLLSTIRPVLVHEIVMGWEPGGYASANSGHLVGFIIGTSGSGFLSFTDPVRAAANAWVGIARCNTGTFWGWKAPGAVAPTLNPIPGFVPTQYAKQSHRFYAATRTQFARYELWINDILIGALDWSTASAPLYNFTNDRGVSPIYLGSNNAGFDAATPVTLWREWSLRAGPDLPTTL